MAAFYPTIPSNHPDHIFRSVFQLSSLDSTSQQRRSQDSSSAWHLVTSWLDPESDRTQTPATIEGLDNALSDLLRYRETASSLIDWWSSAAYEHQQRSLLPALSSLWQSPIPSSQANSVLSRTLDLLITSHKALIEPVSAWLTTSKDPRLSGQVDHLRRAFLDRVYANALHALPSKRLYKTLSFVLHQCLCAWLLPTDSESLAAHAQSTRILLNSLKDSGLGGPVGQRALAYAMNSLIITFVQSPAVKVDWVARESVIDRLRAWTRDTFTPVAKDCLHCLTGDSNDAPLDNSIVEWTKFALEKLARQRIKYIFEYVRAWDHSAGAILDLKYIQHTVEGKLLLANTFSQQMSRRMLHAGVTTSELLTMYINVVFAFKALDSRGVLLDKVAAPLRSYLRQREDCVRIIAASFLADVDDQGHVPKQSDEVCSDLAREIAVSEGEQLKMDEKGLDWDDMNWVPDPIDAGPDYKKSKNDDVMSFMLSLFERDDFLQEIQALLGERLLTAEAVHSDLGKEIRLVELFKTRFGSEGLQSCEVMLRDILDSKRINATLRPSGNARFPTISEIHAAVPENGMSLLGLFDHFQSRIPRTDKAREHFHKLVKEVTTKDRLSGLLFVKSNAELPDEADPAFTTLILSSFFWPELREDKFEVPRPIKALQQSFEADFERIKHLRKLHWQPALGHVAVELELDDRTVFVEGVQTWQASVIYAFQENNANNATDTAVQKTIAELEESLEMEELLVRNAISFWVSHRVLTEVGPDTYSVLESLPAVGSHEATSVPAPAMAQADAAISAVKTQDAVLRDNRDMYELFMVGMLTNGGAMDPSRITMMMKMVVPGGYAFGEEETRWLLSGLVETGKVVENGSNYAIKK